MSNKKTIHHILRDDHLTCKPLDSYGEILLFLENPPPWRSLCKGMRAHSNLLIQNIEVISHLLLPPGPKTFCHFDEDRDDTKRYEAKSLRKTLVCHDMANGYHDDSKIDGTSNYGGYTFYNWAGIDIFCYFSHHLVTIPPVGWINIGHAHGVKVIGTIITEWGDGTQFWEKMLASEMEYQNLASALVAIAKTLNFDGWLLNVENKISKPDVLLEFVRYFHRVLHEELEHAVLVWYDSVTIEGNLNWQNGLNQKNRAFFDACDGFFTNYSWSVNDVATSAAEADERVTDLYIGIDVWGRNFYGGGQFNTEEAVKVAYRSGCSLAIFAPAWTHEALSTKKEDPNYVVMGETLDKYNRFLLRDRAFWGSIWHYLNTRVPCELPFQTSFCRGQGRTRRMYGEVLSPSPWYNLRHQQYQPNAAHGPHGYVFSTAEKIIKISHSKATKGIMKYHESIENARQEPLSFSQESMVSTVESIDSVRVHENIQTIDRLLIKSDDGIDAGHQRKIGKYKSIFKNLFKRKAVKISDANSGARDITDETIDDTAGPSSDNVATHSDQAMVNTSVNLRLGASTGRKRVCLAYVSEERECLEQNFDDSFTGGSCIQVNPSDVLSTDHRCTRLFFCDFSCEDTLVFCVVTKTLLQFANQSLNVNLFMKNAKQEDLRVILTGRSVRQASHLDPTSSGIKYVYPLDTASEEVFRDLRTYLLLNEPNFYVPVENAYDWIVRYYQVSVPGSRVTSINLRTGLPQGGILLGHFGVCGRIHQPDLKV